MAATRSLSTYLIGGMAFGAGVLVTVLWFTMPAAPGSGAPGSGAPGGGPGSGGGGPGGVGGGMMQMPPATVRLGKAEVQNIRRRAAVVGRLRELKRATVAAEVEGKVMRVPVEEGDVVVGGETVLAEIDGVWAKQDLKIAEARVAAAQATLDQAELDLNYLERLLKAQSAKPKEVDDQRAQVASDRAALNAAVAERDRVAREVERLVVLAPFDGVVTVKITEAGQWVAPGDDIVELISQGELDAVVDVPEHLIDQVRRGDPADVIVGPLGLSVRGEVVAINPDGQNAARTFPVKVRLKDADGKLKAGMSVTVWLPVGEEGEFLTVPKDGVSYTLDGNYVWVETPVEGSPMPSSVSVPVRVLFASGDRVVVEALSGGESGPLRDGVRVVVEGFSNLIPGQSLIDADAPSGPPGGGEAGAT